jgi:pimeloyl-ACP methyl ester carboxylesterase
MTRSHSGIAWTRGWLVLVVVLWSAAASAAPKIEVGELDGAMYRIDVPDPWNGSFVIMPLGYNTAPVKFSATSPADPLVSVLLARGFAVARTGYRTGGWAVSEGVQDSERLRQHVVKTYGKPRQTFAAGYSYGGFITMVLIEGAPEAYDGGLALCAPLGAADLFMARRVFDLRVVFDYYFPDLLPSPAAIPASFAATPQVQASVHAALEQAPEKARALVRYSGIRTNAELAYVVPYFTSILADLQRRAGGNPFSNRNTIYESLDNDVAVNAGVKRYDANPEAAKFMRANYSPTGRLSRPLLSVQNIYDPLIPNWLKHLYGHLADHAGGGAWFSQTFSAGEGHCQIPAKDIDCAVTALAGSRRNGERPDLTAACTP